MENIMKALQNIQNELAQQKQDMKTMEENIKETIIKSMDEKFKLLETKTSNLEIKLEQQEKTIEFLNKEIRKNNLVFFGIDETEKNYEELLKLILDVINIKMGTPCQKSEIQNVKRIGKGNGKIRPIIVTTTTTLRKIELLRKKKTLHNTGLYIKEDYSPTVLQKRKEMQEVLKREREAGNKVFLRYDKLIRLDQNHKQRYQSQNNKRSLTESPEGAGGSEAYGNTENIKQIPKKNKSRDIMNTPPIITKICQTPKNS